MRLTVIGHAALYVETDGPSILVDPWLFGSVYWRSWWHYPPSPEPRREWLAPDYVHLTHHHFDHFHYPSMRRIDRRAKVLIPRFGVDVMAAELRALGFRDVQELRHGEALEIATDVEVTSFQYGADDTTFAIRAGMHSVVDVNDCKIRGRSLSALARELQQPTFMLKSHSWAQAYPWSYEADDPAELRKLSRQGYIDDFLDVARELQPRFAVPFGSMVAFLHPESRHLNEHLITPHEVERASANAPGLERTAIVTMSPGDRWSSDEGFERSDVDWYTDRPARLTELADAVAPTLTAEAADEAARPMRFDDFGRYFTAFARAVPRAIAHAALPRPVVFEVSTDPEPYWVVDIQHRRVWRSVALPEGHASVITIAPGVLADAIEKRIVQLVHGGVRVRVSLRRGAFREDLAFWALLTAWELGYLPMRNVANARFLDTIWRRRVEMVDDIRALLARGPATDRILRRFATTETTGQPPA